MVMSADHVYRLDFAELVEGAPRAGRRVHRGDDRGRRRPTPPTTPCSPSTATASSSVSYKPEHPDHGLVAAEIVAYRPDVLIEVLEELHRELGPDAEQGDTGLGDFGDHLLPRLVGARPHRSATGWRATGATSGSRTTTCAPTRSCCADDLGVLNDPDWPILTRHTQRGPARLLDGAETVDSMVSSGCVVAGRVERSVLGPGVRVEPGARVTDSVLFADVVVEADAEVVAAIVDKHCRIGRGARVGSDDADLGDSGDIVLLGRDSTVGEGAVVAPGARLEPGGSA